MENLEKIIEDNLDGDLIKAVISNGSEESQYKKITINKKEKSYQAEKYTKTQVFHENISNENLWEFIRQYFGVSFKQLNLFTNTHEFNLKISKKGKLLWGRSKIEKEHPIELGHDRKKEYILEEGTSIPPLVDMGIFTKDNKVVKSMYSKYRQINRFVEIIDDSIEKLALKKLNIIDFGCGKSYLTFILYYYLTQIKNIDANIVGLDLKEDVIDNCNIAAEKYGYKNLKFKLGDIEGYEEDLPVDMVISLHACDTATDQVIYNGIKWNAKLILSVPCCQHELNEQIESEEFSVLTKYGIVKERVAALMTDAIRGSLLEYCGYKTQLLEFIDITHTPKNILIRAYRANISKVKREKSLNEVKGLMREFKLNPTLFKLIEEGEAH